MRFSNQPFHAVLNSLALLSLALCAASAEAQDAAADQFASSGPSVSITDATATPNPAAVGQSVTFSGKVKGKLADFSSATIDFGDGTFLVFNDPASFDAFLDEELVHTYATAGVFEARVTVSGGEFFASASVFVVVGRGTAINGANGIFSTATDAAGMSRAEGAASRFSNGDARLRINAAKVGAFAAETDFDDIPGRVSLAVPGLNVAHVYTTAGIFVATTRALSGTTVRGTVRKMITISAKDTGNSAALADPPSTDIKMKKFSGKFLFTKSTPDKVSFSGMITLPAGFNPSRPDGNTLSVGIGNVVENLTVDAKGKVAPGAKISKAKVKFPKTSGVTAGGESAQIDITASLADLDTAGFDTEGITPTLRSGEFGLKAATRFVQVSILLGGVPYETLAPVDFKVSKKGDAGQIKGRVDKK